MKKCKVITFMIVVFILVSTIIATASQEVWWKKVSWISASHTGVESGTDYYYIVVPDTYVVISTKTEVTESPRPGTYGGYFEETTWRTWGEPDDFQ